MTVMVEGNSNLNIYITAWTSILQIFYSVTTTDYGHTDFLPHLQILDAFLAHSINVTLYCCTYNNIYLTDNTRHANDSIKHNTVSHHFLSALSFWHKLSFNSQVIAQALASSFHSSTPVGRRMRELYLGLYMWASIQ